MVICSGVAPAANASTAAHTSSCVGLAGSRATAAIMRSRLRRSPLYEAVIQ